MECDCGRREAKGKGEAGAGGKCKSKNFVKELVESKKPNCK